MTHKVNIEIMVDTNANSRKLDRQYDDLREMAQQQEAGHARTISEFRSYLRQARNIGVECEVTQRDTAQIFHEKTNLMTPELAAQGGYEIWPDFIRENLQNGHYHVEPPIHGEAEYYDALEKYLNKILPEKAPEDVQKLESITPENRGLVLQDLYRDHMMDLSGKYRNGKYKKDFDAYREVRFNAGEVTAISFLKNHPLPPEGERTAFVFVGSDKWANQEMAKARGHMKQEDAGKFEVFVVEPSKFRGLMEEVIRSVEKKNPEMGDFRRRSFKELAKIGVEDVPAAQADAAMKEGYTQKLAGARKAAAVQPISDEARAFAGFVTRLDGEERGEGRGR